MKKNIKKITALLMTTAVLVLSATGCAQLTGKTQEDVIVWYMQKPTSDMSHQNMVEEAANEIIYKELGVKLKFEFVDSGAWAEKKNVLISSGEEFDIISDNGTSFVNNASKMAYVDIGEYLSKYGEDILAKVDKNAWEAVKVNGKVVGIPGQSFYVPYNSFAFKADIVKKYNIDYKDIKTIEDLEPILETIKQNEQGIYPICALANTPIPMQFSDNEVYSTVSGIMFDIENDKFISEIDSQWFLKRTKITNDFYKKGYIPADAISKTETVSEIKSGKYAIFTGRRNAEKTSSLYGFECVESDPTYGYINSANILNSVNAVSRTSKHPDKAIQVLNLIWKDRNLSNLLAYGIENVDYEVVSGKGTDDISILPKSGNEVKWSIWHNWLGPLWDQWDSTWNRTEALEEMRRLNEEASCSPILGFYPELSELKTECAAISSIQKEAASVFCTGSMPDYDAYVNTVKTKYKDAGIDKVIDTMQKQYEEWKKTKAED